MHRLAPQSPQEHCRSRQEVLRPDARRRAARKQRKLTPHPSSADQPETLGDCGRPAARHQVWLAGSDPKKQRAPNAHRHMKNDDNGFGSTGYRESSWALKARRGSSWQSKIVELQLFAQRLQGYSHGFPAPRCRPPINTSAVEGINNTIRSSSVELTGTATRNISPPESAPRSPVIFAGSYL